MVSFELGRLVATPAALEALAECGQTSLQFVRRHARGDWGDVDASDAKSNLAALEDGSRIWSAYVLKNEQWLWVITDATDDDGRRRSTCVLLPDDY